MSDNFITNHDANRPPSSQPIPGKAIADELIQGLANDVGQMERVPTLHIFLDPTNEVSAKYVNYKREVAAQVGINTQVHEINHDTTTSKLVTAINQVTVDNLARVIVQLPLPKPLDQQEVLTSIPARADVDVLNRTFNSHPYQQPVAAAVQKALAFANYSELSLSTLPDDAIHVIGRGFLVGQPVADWLQSLGVNPVVYQRGDDLDALHQAKIVIAGAGVSNLIQPRYLTPGVVLIDAGTSSASGEVLGDIDPACYPLASYYTPVPRGIGPLTLAMLLSNCVH